MYKIFDDDSPAVPDPDEVLATLNKMKVGQIFDLPRSDNHRVRYGMGKIQKTSTKRFTCFSMGGDQYRCKRLA